MWCVSIKTNFKRVFNWYFPLRSILYLILIMLLLCCISKLLYMKLAEIDTLLSYSLQKEIQGTLGQLMITAVVNDLMSHLLKHRHFENSSVDLLFLCVSYLFIYFHTAANPPFFSKWKKGWWAYWSWCYASEPYCGETVQVIP